MARKNKDAKRGGGTPAHAPGLFDGFSARGKKAMAIGAALVAFGFIALSRADAMGRNWASVLSPFLIVGGYAAIGLGIFLPEPPAASRSSPDLPKTIEP